MSCLVRPGFDGGELSLPPSKSQSMRALFLASLARGESKVEQVLDSPDTEAMIRACQSFGARIRADGNRYWVAGGLGPPRALSIDSGNSGLVLRFFSAAAAVFSYPITITGDASICNYRVIAPLVSALRQLGVKVCYLEKEGYAPIEVQGAVQAGRATLLGRDSQPVSALLMMAACSKGNFTFDVEDPGELPWIDMTLDWLNRLQVPFQREGYHRFSVEGRGFLPSFNYQVPPDLSASLFPLIAALIHQKKLLLKGLDLSEIAFQGECQFFELLKTFGSSFVATGAGVLFTPGDIPYGEIEVNAFIDAVPILAVMGCFSSQPLVLKKAAIARFKECDRLSKSVLELGKMGAKIEELDDGLKIYPSKLCGAVLDAHHDHRMAMALMVAATKAQMVSEIVDIACIKKSFPSYIQEMKNLGADFEPVVDSYRI